MKATQTNSINPSASTDDCMLELSESELDTVVGGIENTKISSVSVINWTLSGNGSGYTKSNSYYTYKWNIKGVTLLYTNSGK